MLSTQNRSCPHEGRRSHLAVLSAVLAMFGLLTLLTGGADRALAQSSRTVAAAHVRASERPNVAPLPVDASVETNLEEETEMEFFEDPLSDTLLFLEDKHAVQMELDKRSLDDANISTETPITRSLAGVSCRTALKLTLADLDLTYFVQDGLVHVTTVKTEKSTFFTRTYPVDDLCETPDDVEELVHAVVTTIDPQSWAESENQGSIAALGFSRTLCVRQTYHNHREVLTLLKSLRQAEEARARAGRAVQTTRSDSAPPSRF